MAAYNNLYTDVFDILESSTTIKHVEDFNDQYNDMENYNLCKYPACYVETGEVTWDKNENNYYELSQSPQTGLASIKIHVVYHTLKQFDKTTKTLFFNTVDHVSLLLQKTQSGNRIEGTYSTLLRTKEEYLSPNKQLRVAILTFETQLKDVFVERTDYVTETVSLVLITEI
jgi:hypothetical protein